MHPASPPAPRQARWVGHITLRLLALALSAAFAPAQPPTGNPTLVAVARAMGSNRLHSIEITANGTSATSKPGGGGPVKVRYRQAINYANGSMRIDLERTNPGAAPEGPVILAPGADRPALALQLWMTPHGVIKAAQKSSVTVSDRSFSFKSGDTNVKVTLTFDNLVAKTEARVDDPTAGDTLIEWEYSNYKDFGGLAFPMKIVEKQGGHPILDLAVSGVTLDGNVTIEPSRAPQNGGASPAAGSGAAQR